MGVAERVRAGGAAAAPGARPGGFARWRSRLLESPG